MVNCSMGLSSMGEKSSDIAPRLLKLKDQKHSPEEFYQLTTLLKKRLHPSCSPVKFAKFSNSFFVGHLWATTFERLIFKNLWNTTETLPLYVRVEYLD